MSPDVVRKIISAYGLDATSIGERQSGYRNHSFRITQRGSSALNLIIYKHEAGIVNRIKNANAVSAFATSCGLPTRTPIGPGIIRLSNERATRYAALYNYLPGETIPWEAYTHAHLVLLGQTMSAMHYGLSTAPQSVTNRLPRAIDELRTIAQRVDSYFNETQVSRAAQAKLGITISPTITPRYNAVLTALSRLPASHALHMDFVRSNILFDPTSAIPVITGILDFEKTSFGPPIVDVARTLSFLLVDSTFKDSYHVRKYFLTSGYNKRDPIPLKLIKVTAGTRSFSLLDELINCFLIYDLYKFMRHNPYESLPANHHYLRTVAILERHGLVYQANRFAQALS